MESMHDLEVLIDSGRRFIVIETDSEGCFIDGFRRIAKRSNKAYFTWTVTKGLRRLAAGYEPQAITKETGQLFSQIQSTLHPGVYVLVDFHHSLEDPVAVRHIKDTLLHAKHHCLILLSTKIELPQELRAKATHYSLPLPTSSQLNSLVNELAVEWLQEKGSKLKQSERGMVRKLVASLCGLSFADASRMARHAIFNDGIIDQHDIREIAQQKFDLLNMNNVLQLELDYAELDEIAGFEKLKSWLAIRKQVFLKQVQLPGGDIPKGMLLLGVQGCGKSLAAKAVAGSWSLPLLHLDFATLYNRFYGQTEENLRLALQAAEKMQPCVLWLDEVEKGLSAVSTSDDVSKRMLGTFLTWLAEKKEAVFVVATANDVHALPPELLRKGRFDEVFFVDLPRQRDRAAILSLHLANREQNLSTDEIDQVAQATDGFSGAELEELIVSSMYHSYESDTKITLPLVLELAKQTKPLSVLMHERIEALREWASGRAVAV